jgi:hypothetical protein
MRETVFATARTFADASTVGTLTTRALVTGVEATRVQATRAIRVGYAATLRPRS